MNTKDFLQMGIPLGQATRRATDFVAQFILGGGFGKRRDVNKPRNPAKSWTVE